MRKQDKPLKPNRKAKPATAPERPGLRQRKQQQTRERITKAAMTLFMKHGFEAATLDEIAAAADISRRSFFHYFESKEDVVFAWQEASTAGLIAAVAARPLDESMLTAAENAIAAMIGQLDIREAVALARLKRDNPALQARDQVKYEKLERALAEALVQRSPYKPDAFFARLAAMVATGAMRIAGDIWIAEGANEKPEALIKRTFKTLRAVLSEPPVAARRSKT